jgi:hypothetical protein
MVTHEICWSFILYSAICILYSVFCILYSVFCILYSVLHVVSFRVLCDFRDTPLPMRFESYYSILFFHGSNVCLGCVCPRLLFTVEGSQIIRKGKSSLT